MGDRTLDYIALGIFCFVGLTLVYAIIYIHDIPYEIAKKRNHPHQDAIHTAGWVSLFLMHTIWPFLWIWATLYKPGAGWGISGQATPDKLPDNDQSSIVIDTLSARIEELERREQQNQDEQLLEQLQQLQARIAELESQQLSVKED